MKKTLRTIFRIILAALFSFQLQVPHAADIKPVDVRHDDKCRVCGMFVAKYKNWIAQIIFDDATYAAFDGPKDMFRYYFNLNKYNPSKKQSDMTAVFVTEYYSTKIMDAKKMFFVSGSDVYGPMGAELIPVESEKTAKEFMKDHHGKRILRFGDITMEDLK
ncbi:MAG: nitrous oxide reductase accessory protein NosL [Nitrospirota bacterium]